jgi:hypothetical protein
MGNRSSYKYTKNGQTVNAKLTEELLRTAYKLYTNTIKKANLMSNLKKEKKWQKKSVALEKGVVV